MSFTPPAPHDAPPTPAALAAHDALPPGTQFGELEIVRVLGIGGFGIVYLANDRALQRQVALKEYMPGSLAGRGKGQMVSVRSGAHRETYALGLRSFVNEARLLARFNHPSLVKVYRFWEQNGTAYMVMPYLQGRTVRDVRRAMAQPPSEGFVRSIVDPLLDALELLHREDVYHRDIAPDNVLLPPGEPPVLLDFGAARRAIGDSTQTFTAILKPNYAPIEQYAEVSQLRQGPWTDLYALGAVVHYLLCGAPPPPATARAVADDARLLQPQDHPDVSPALLAAFEWALAVRPADRPQSIAALRDVIEGRTRAPPPRASAATQPPRTVVMPPEESRSFVTTQQITTQQLTAPAPAEASSRPEFGDTTVMPSRPTVDAPARRWPHARVAASALAAGAAVAVAVWVAQRDAPLAAPGDALALPAAAPAPGPAAAGAATAEDPSSVVPVAASLEPSREMLVPPAPKDAEPAPSAALPLRPATARRLDAARAAAASNAGLPADAPRSPREACGNRRFFALAACMEQQCEQPRFRAHPQCERVREMVERRRLADDGD